MSPVALVSDGFSSFPGLRPQRLISAALLLVLVTACQADVTRSFDLRVPAPPTPVPVEDSLRLVYELHLTNFGERPLRVKKLEVSEAGTDRAFMILGPAELSKRLFRPGAGPDKALFGSGGTGVVYMELVFYGAELPQRLAHRVSFTAADEEAVTTVAGDPVPVRDEPPVVLSPPLRGGPWVAVYDPGWPRGHRRVIYAVDGKTTIPGRYAIDWIRIDRQGRFATGDRDQTGNWYGYGADVLAAADGVVAAMRDDVPESDTVSGQPEQSLEDATGNYVAIDVGDSRFLFYEHLKPGSIRVEVGERVKGGQVIAGLGFTGQSTGPHLHFHVADANSPLGAEGLPFVLEEFVLLGAYEDFDRLGSERWRPADAALEKSRRHERPAPNAVVEFR